MTTSALLHAAAGARSTSQPPPDNLVILGSVAILVILLLVIGGGALTALLVTGISRFRSKHTPSADTMSAFNADQASRLRAYWEVKQPETSMSRVHDTEITGDQDDESIDSDTLVSDDPLSSALGRYSKYVALLAAWVATCGSLFMSEVLGWVPCLLCWYQRILMYPLSIILAVGILRRDKGLHKYALALSVPGAFVSLYHYLYQKTDLFRGMVPCTVGVPCSSDYLNWLGGVVTIPFLALIAFLIITFCMVASRLGSSSNDREETAQAAPAQENTRRVMAALPVIAIIVAVVLAFIVAGAFYRSTAASAVQTDTPVSVQQLPTPDSTAMARGKVLYEESCAACHGLRGEGTQAGRALADSTLLQTGSDAELATFVRAGRTTQDPHNTTGLAMPASGGRTDIGDQDLAAIIAYIRSLAKHTS
ncbi:MAG: disulfide oxidoreductase [Chloroflexi bacterium]|nr:disulfide oxidoreductase [Chloroflexota bacterium]